MALVGGFDFNQSKFNRATQALRQVGSNIKPFLYTANGTPGWYTINLKTSYAFTQNVQMNLGVENILDSHYRPYTSGISAPGRNVIVAFRLSI